MSVFTSHNSVEKQKTRDYLINMIPMLNKRKPKLLTLPADNFIFEKQVLKHYKHAKIDCMELDHTLYNKVKNQLPVADVNYEYGDIFDKLASNPQQYDLVWIDLCGNLSLNNLNNLVSAAQCFLKEKSIFAFTLTVAREQRSAVYADVYQTSGKELRFDFLPKFLTEMARLTCPKFSLHKIMPYKNSTQSVPMSLYVFKTF
jgi:hypothetical protein